MQTVATASRRRSVKDHYFTDYLCLIRFCAAMWLDFAPAYMPDLYCAMRTQPGDDEVPAFILPKRE
jgi:hypothetical protein